MEESSMTADERAAHADDAANSETNTNTETSATGVEPQSINATTSPAASEPPATLSAAARRERLAELAAAIGESAIVEGDKLMVETGQVVAVYSRVEPDGSLVLTWWMTGNAPTGHPRWGDAARSILGPGETIHTSALGGGFLVEVERRAASIPDAAALARDPGPSERALALIAAFPDAVAALPPEPVPDYLLPDREVS
jgi:hypothetical protein